MKINWNEKREIYVGHLILILFSTEFMRKKNEEDGSIFGRGVKISFSSWGIGHRLSVLVSASNIRFTKNASY